MPYSPRLSASPRRRALLAAAPLAMAAALAGCGGPDLPRFPPACPQVGILSDAADLTRFRSGGTDLTDMVVDGRITGLLNASCKLLDYTHLRTTLAVGIDVTRGPAARGARQQVTYFVSVSKGDTILDKQLYTLNLDFPDNVSRLRLSGEQLDIVLPVKDVNDGASYRILVGFQLTPAELAFNRRRGPR